MPYSGPASAYGVIGRTESRLFQDDQRAGRRERPQDQFISLDDAYSPPKTVEQVRRLVEDEKVAFLFQTLGTAPNLAIRQYLNDNKVPQLFVSTGASDVLRSRAFPLDDGLQPELPDRGAHLRQSTFWRPSRTARSRVLYQNDGFGKDYLIGLKDGLGADHAGMVVEGGVLRDLGADGRFADRDAAGLGRRHSAHRRDAEVRGAGDPKVLRSRLGRGCAISPTSRRRSPRC